MKPGDIKLIVVLGICVICAGLLASKLAKDQKELAPSRHVSYASKLPIGGFQKFMADVFWMRFLNFAGSNQLTEDNVDQYESYIQKLISLDPGFYRVYRDGALFLGPTDTDKALKIIDMGLEHPRISKHWELPLLGGQIIMRKEWRKHYAGKDMDLELVRRARDYFARAKDIRGHLPAALNNFIRTEAILRENDLPREVNELDVWSEHLETYIVSHDSYGEVGEDGVDLPYSMDELEDKVTRQIQKVAKLYIQNPAANEKHRQLAEKKVLEKINRLFPFTRFDPDSYTAYNETNVANYQGYIEDPKEKPYIIDLSAKWPFAVSLITTKLRKGKGKLTVKLNGQPVVGLTNIPIGAEKVTYPLMLERELETDSKLPGEESQKIKYRPSLKQNKAGPGAVIELEFSELENAEDLNYILQVYRGDYR